MKKLLILLILLIAGIVAFDMLFPAQAAHYGVALERWRNGLESKSIDVDGMQIAYNEGGQGEPLLLIHGFGADKDNWTRVAGHLTPHYRVIAIDLPGFGQSSRIPNAEFDIVSQTRRVHQIASALGLERFHLGGSSMGGNISLTYAGLYPDQVMSLWVLAPAGVEGSEISELRRRYAQTGENALIVKQAEDFPSIMQFTMSKPPFLPYSVKHQLGLRAAADHDLHKRIFETLNRDAQSVNALIKDSPIPALVVWGDQDRALHYSGADILKSLMPNAKIMVRPGIGHLPMIEEPQRSAQDWLSFQSSQ